MIRFVLAFVCLLVASSVTQAAIGKACTGSKCQNPAFASSSYTVVEQAAPAPAPAPMPSGSYVPQRLPVGPASPAHTSERHGLFSGRLFNGNGLFHRREGRGHGRCH